jgi:hypothetical protein
MELTIEDIPENSAIKMIRQTNNIKPIPKQYAKQVRFQEQPKLTNISYDDILNKMGMFVKDGKLHSVSQSSQSQIPQSQSPQNSYIYNKYFKNELQQESTSRVPRTIDEYKLMLVKDIIQKEKIKRIKSTKLVMPNSNIAQRSQANLNKLFSFSK